MNLSDALSNLLQGSGRRISQAIAEANEEQGGNGGGGGKKKKTTSLKDLEKKWKAEMANYDALIEYAENTGDYESLFTHYADARAFAEKVAEAYRARGYADDSTQVLSWLNRGYDYSAAADETYEELFSGLTDSLKDLTSALDSASALQEKSLALQEAQYDLDSAREAVERAGEGLENAKKQRTVRIWNEETDSWDYIADAAAVSSAEELLKKREAELRKAENSYIKAESNLSKLTLSSQLQAFTESSGTVIGSELADLIASALKNYSPGDSGTQNVNYYFQNGISIGSAEAETMTLAQLAKLLGNLEVY